MLEQLKESIHLLWNKLLGWLDNFILILPNLLIAIFIVFISAYGVRYIRKYAKKLTAKIIDNKSIINLISNAVTIVFWMVSILITLEILNLDTALKSLLAGAGVVGLAVGLALQEPIINTISGVVLSVKNYYNIGDLVETNGHVGHISRITLRNTVLTQITGEKVIIPNKDIIHNPIINYSIIGRRKVVLECGVGYEDNLNRVEAVTKKAIFERFEEVPSEEAVEFFYTEFGGSSVNFTLRFWLNVDSRIGHLQAKSQSIIALKQAFDKAGFNIPFPIRTLDIDSKALEPIANKLVASIEKTVQTSSAN
ncbi:MAG: mechanosensitive ion channel family protein [Saprospiraceae bacterium]